MTLASSFHRLLQPLAEVMTRPSFRNFIIIVTGWIFASRRTVTAMLLAAGVAGQRHHSIFHRFFARAQWSLDALGLALFALIKPWLVDHELVHLGIDDTLARKRGRKMFGVGTHLDPLISSRSRAVVNHGHSWVILGVIVQLPFCSQRYFCLPILFRMYLNHKAAQRHRRAYRTRPQLAVEMVQKLCSAHEDLHFHLIGDTAYGGQHVLNQLPGNCELTSRLPLNARLYEAPPPRRAGQRGRPRKRGDSLPTPEQMLQRRARHVELGIYGRKDKARVSDADGRWHAVPEKPLRVVAVEPLNGGRGQQAFYSTLHQASAEQVLTWYAMRWSIEVTFHDAKQHLGFEQPQSWSRRAAQRTAPMAMLIYSLVILWFAHAGHRLYRRPKRPWYPHKPHASFRDMLATLRCASIREYFSKTGFRGPGRRKILHTLETAVGAAA